MDLYFPTVPGLVCRRELVSYLGLRESTPTPPNGTQAFSDVVFLSFGLRKSESGKQPVFFSGRLRFDQYSCSGGSGRLLAILS